MRKDPTQANGLNIQEESLPVFGSNPYFKEEIVEISNRERLARFVAKNKNMMTTVLPLSLE